MGKGNGAQDTRKSVRIPVKVRAVVNVPAKAEKTTFTRSDLPGGDFLINYYYVRDRQGRLIPEDVDSATHFERVVYDRDGNVIGSMIGELTSRVRW